MAIQLIFLELTLSILIGQRGREQKEKYGGPFTEEEVEDVKTVFRMLPLFIAPVGFCCTDYFSHLVDLSGNLSLIPCMVANNFGYYTSSLVLLLIYLFIIRVCFYKYIPSMLIKIGVGLIFALAVVFFHTVFFKVILTPDQGPPDSPYTNKLLFIPQISQGIAFVLIIPTSLEFTVAQAPVHMRGVMVGMWYASIGVGYLINAIIKFPLGCQNE